MTVNGSSTRQNGHSGEIPNKLSSKAHAFIFCADDGESLSLSSLLGFSVFSALLLARIITHSPWRDEAQAWLIAEFKSLPDLLLLPGEGHPPLWYLLLLPFTRINPELYVLKIPTAILGVVTLALLWFRSRVSTSSKTLISASFYLSFQYAVFGRSYILGTFFLILYASFFPAWRRQPSLGGLVLGLAALTHIYFGLAALVLCVSTVAYWRGSCTVRHAPMRFVLTFASLYIASIASVIGSVPHDVEHLKLTGVPPAGPLQVFQKVELYARAISTAFTAGLPSSISSVLALAVPPILLLSSVRRTLIGIILCLGWFAIATFLVLVHGGDVHHSGIVYVLFLAWYIIDSSQFSVFGRRVLLLLAALGGLNQLRVELKVSYPYSSSFEAAQMIRAAGLDHASWVSFPDYTGTATFAILRRSAFSLECECDFTYVDWTKRSRHWDGRSPSSPEELSRRLQQLFSKRGLSAVYVLLSLDQEQVFSRALPFGFKQVEIGYTFKSLRYDETFRLLRIDAG
jgi:hypothetical protein